MFCFASNLLAARAESCSKIVRKRLEVVQKLTESCPKVAPNHNRRNCHESSPRKSCGPLDRTILHRISVRTFCDDEAVWDRGQLLGPET